VRDEEALGATAVLSVLSLHQGANSCMRRSAHRLMLWVQDMRFSKRFVCIEEENVHVFRRAVWPALAAAKLEFSAEVAAAMDATGSDRVVTSCSLAFIEASYRICYAINASRRTKDRRWPIAWNPCSSSTFRGGVELRVLL